MPIIEPIHQNIIKCADIIRNGGIVAFPTETVYGLGASALNIKAVKKIFRMKKRPFYDPLIVHISSMNQLYNIAHCNKKTKELLKKLWPGPLTVVLKKKDIIPDIVTAGLDSVAVRFPSNPIALKLLKYSKLPIAAPSANKFSRLSPTKAEHVLKYFKDINIIDGGKTVYGIESTVIKIEDDTIYILRHGAVSIEDIKKHWKGKIKEYQASKKISPGLTKKHYSPSKKLKVIKSQKEITDPERAAFISFAEKPIKKYALFLDLSPSADINEAASNLFEYLHIAEEDYNVKKIYVKAIKEVGKGKAIMERLKKASC
ncbi:MAG: L-threonylcarbamoyladenylate synthase [Elusimicrobiales bacterium]